MGRFSKASELGGIAKRNSSRLAKNSASSLSESAREVMHNKYLKHLESDNMSAGKVVPESLVYAQVEVLKLPKKKQRKKGRLEELKRLPLQVSLQAAIQDAKYETSEKKEKSEKEKEKPNYLTINSQPSLRPVQVRICGMCGFKACYTCIQCKAFYCSLACKETHTETRCLKWKV